MEVTSGVLTTTLKTFLDVLSTGRGLLTKDALSLLSVLVAMELTLAGAWWAYSGNEALGKFLKKVLLICFFKWVVTDYDIINAWLIKGFVYSGVTAAGVATPNSVLESPSALIDQARVLVDPLFQLAVKFGHSWNFFDAAVTFLMALFVYIALVLIAIQVFITRIEFALISTLGIVLLPFGVFRYTHFLAERVFGAVISFGVKLMVLAFVLSLAFPILQNLQLPQNPDWTQMFTLAALCATIAVLSVHAPGVAAGLLSGSPSLNNAVTAMGAAFGGAAASGVNRAVVAPLAAGSGIAAAAALSAVSKAPSNTQRETSTTFTTFHDRSNTQTNPTSGTNATNSSSSAQLKSNLADSIRSGTFEGAGSGAANNDGNFKAKSVNGDMAANSKKGKKNSTVGNVVAGTIKKAGDAVPSALKFAGQIAGNDTHPSGGISVPLRDKGGD